MAQGGMNRIFCSLFDLYALCIQRRVYASCMVFYLCFFARNLLLLYIDIIYWNWKIWISFSCACLVLVWFLWNLSIELCEWLKYCVYLLIFVSGKENISLLSIDSFHWKKRLACSYLHVFESSTTFNMSLNHSDKIKL